MVLGNTAHSIKKEMLSTSLLPQFLYKNRSCLPSNFCRFWHVSSTPNKTH